MKRIKLPTCTNKLSTGESPTTGAYSPRFTAPVWKSKDDIVTLVRDLSQGSYRRILEG
jgi:hypothetical protein